MRFSAAWGYSSTTDVIIKEELHAGIIGSYNIKPTFNVRFPLNFSMFNMLGTFVNGTVKACGIDNINREECIIRRVSDFNRELSKTYDTRSMYLTMTCDDNAASIAVNRFVEEINNCVSGGDMNCQCNITPSKASIQNIESIDGYTKFSYISGDDISSAYMDYEIKKDDGSLFKDKRISIEDVKLYRSTDDASPLIYADKGVRQCAISKNKYRLCLKTEYDYKIYDPDAKSDLIITKDVILPFAITVRDNVAPKPVEGLTASSVAHAKDIIMLSWNKNSEIDITRYNIYLSDQVSDFSVPTKEFKDNMNYITIGSTENNFEEYESINLDDPVCEPQTSDKGISCIFKYKAVDKNPDKADRDLLIELQKERLYYISSQDKFVYIMDGTDPKYGLVTNNERYLAMTAADVDGNEIDNIKTTPDEKITQGKNLISVTPLDKLEPGLTKIKEYNVDESYRLRLSWMEVSVYIDGSEIENPLSYNIYILQGSCSIDQLNEISESSSPEATISEANTEIALSQPAPGTQIDYCIYVIPTIDNRGYMEGFAVQVSLIGPSDGSGGGSFNPLGQSLGGTPSGSTSGAGTVPIITGLLFP